MQNTMEKQKFSFPPWGWIFVFFGIVFTMNGIMIYLAFSTWNGLSTSDAYEKGLRHNMTLEESTKQKALGWQNTVSWNNETHTLKVVTLDKSGVAIKEAEVSAVLFRPTTQGHDKTFPLQESENGTYTQSLKGSILKGQWEARITVKKGENRAEFRQRIMVK